MKLKRLRTSKYEENLEEIWALYYSGKTPAQIEKIIGIPIQSFYRLKKSKNWELKKRELDKRAQKKFQEEFVNTKSRALALVQEFSIKGLENIRDQIDENKADLKVSDITTLVKNLLLLGGDATEITEKKNSISIQELDTVIDHLSVEERGKIEEAVEILECKINEIGLMHSNA